MTTTSKLTTLTLTDLKYCSLYDGDHGGSMHELLKLAGMTPVPQAKMSTADVLVFNGGADIGTDIYSEKSIWPGQIPHLPSHRDRTEMEIFNRFSDPSILKIGICRGAQLLNCLNGGTLWQDVNNHGRDHLMTVLETGITMPITSTHHQMMRPARGATIIATSSESTIKEADQVVWRKNVGPDDPDIEVVYYADTNSLCIQGHPEYVPKSIFANWCVQLFNQYLSEARQHVEA